jgi:hypothetical protein
MKTINLNKLSILLIVALSLVAGMSYADKKDYKKESRPEYYKKDYRSNAIKPYYKDYKRDPSRYRIDKRYNHDYYYPRPGIKLRVLPSRHHTIHYHDRRYYFSSGIWYILSGGVYVVVHPPIGIVIPVLPAFYTTVWYSGVPYYYANDVYYVWRPDLDGYVVTQPPAELVDEKPVPMSDQLFAYPTKGQSEQQQADDRYACHRWSVKQTGYDPTAIPKNKTQNELNQLRAAYQKAMTACLEGKGYSVR